MPAIFPRTPDDPFIQCKAVQLMYDCHALRFPERYEQYAELIEVDPADGERTFMVEAPEYFLTRSDIPVAAKAEHLGYMLLSVLEALAVDGVETPEEAVYDYCDYQWAVTCDTELTDNDGEVLLAQHLLPHTEVLRAVRARWLGRQIELEDFIESAASSERSSRHL